LEDNEIIQQKDDIENNYIDVQLCNTTIFEYKNLINNFASQKARRMNFG
jgi:hypothetical protein